MRVPPEGPVVFAAVARYGGKQVWARIGSADVLGIEEARDKAREAIKRIKDGLPAFEPPPVEPDSFADVSENWLKRHVEAKGLRSADEVERVLERYVPPVWRDRAFADIRRSDVAALLDQIEDEHGKWTADAVLSVLRSLATWFASRNDGYTPPFVKGMRRTSKQERKRTRILSDAELRAVWLAAEAGWRLRCFPADAASDRPAPREGRDHEVDGPRRRRLDHRHRAGREGQPRCAAVAAAGHEDHRGTAARCR